MNKLNNVLRRLTMVALGAAAFAAMGASAAVTVTYAPPDKMTDVPRFSSDRESMEMVFREHLDGLAAKLPAGQQLKVDFLDIDLAGDVFPRVPVRDIRVMKGQADWPRMELRYTIEQNGQTLRSGTSKLSNSSYLTSINSYRNELYGHELQLLDDWFRKEVMPKQ
jgi:hypothetical protein